MTIPPGGTRLSRAFLIPGKDARRSGSRSMAKKKATKKADTAANLGFEEKLWQAADKLRKSVDAAEYKHVVLGLIFLKYVSDAFDELWGRLDEDEREDRDYYVAENVFWVPPAARWDHLQAKAKKSDIGKTVDDAMLAIERDKAARRGVGGIGNIDHADAAHGAVGVNQHHAIFCRRDDFGGRLGRLVHVGGDVCVDRERGDAVEHLLGLGGDRQASGERDRCNGRAKRSLHDGSPPGKERTSSYSPPGDSCVT